jgi:copper transport protein
MAAALALGAVALAAGPAAAHALAQSSDPAAGSTLQNAPAAVTVTFGEPADPALSSLRVLDSAGRDHTGGPTRPVPGRPSSLRVAVGAIGKGVYTVAWRTVSKVDGHLAAGTFAFGVGVAPTGAAASAGLPAHAPAPSVAAVGGRWLLYCGLMLVAGVTAYALVCIRRLPGRLLALLGIGCLLAASGLTLVAVNAWRGDHVPASKLLSSSIGHQFTGRAGPVVAAGVLLAVACLPRFRRSWPARRVVLALCGGAAMVAMWADVAASHAAAARSRRPLQMAVQWAHFAAAGIWVGGLAALLATLPTTAPHDRLPAVKRFSSIALVCVAIVVASGVERGYEEVGTVHSLLHAAFGQDVLVKVGLMGLLVVLGAFSRFRGIPAVARTAGPLRTVVAGEVILVAAVLVATGVLQGLTTPASADRAPVVAPIVLAASDFATSVRVRLEVSPGVAGFNRFQVHVADFDTGRPVTGGVSLDFALPARPELGRSSLTLGPEPMPGAYAANGANMSLDGAWTVTALVQAPTGAVEVPFSVVTRQPPENITVARTGGGLPDIYTLHLNGGRSLQTYVDPGHPAQLNEFHATFIGPDGQELAMASATVSATPGGNLAVRRLDPVGHFVSDLADAVKGPYRFDVSGTTAAGDTVNGTFRIPVQ